MYYKQRFRLVKEGIIYDNEEHKLYEFWPEIKLGADGQNIKPELISYNSRHLITGDILKGSLLGECLYYNKENNSYELITNEPNRFLITQFQNWKKK